MSSLKTIGEFELIDRLTRILPTAPAVIEGIGDDCAVLRVADRQLLVSCDLSMEDVHFTRHHMSSQDIGWKAAASSLSDIAAMGGLPLFCLVSIACPADCDYSYVEGIYTGLSDAIWQTGAVIVGGDTGRSSTGIVLDVTVIGEVIGDRYLARRGARDGDLLGVTGKLGLASAGLWALRHDCNAPVLINAHSRPMPRIDEGQWLAARPEVHAMIDISDGLVQDAGHIANHSKIGVDVDTKRLSVDADLDMFCREHQLDPYKFILTGGEDYELAFAISADDIEVILPNFRREFHTPIHIVGRFTEAWQGVRVNGHPPAHEGFNHFQ